MVFLLLLSMAIPSFAAFHVVVDPGHGGTDHGAVRENVREADIALKVSKFLVEKLEKDSDFKVSVTRSKDEIVPLGTRAHIGNSSHGNLFISIHANSSTDSRANGAEFYFQSQMSLADEELYLANSETKQHSDVGAIITDLKRTYDNYQSQILAETLQNHWKQSLKVRERPILQESFRVLVSVPMPSVLVELGFISNNKERDWMNTPSSQKYMAELLYDGIKEFKEKIDKSPLSSHITENAAR